MSLNEFSDRWRAYDREQHSGDGDGVDDAFADKRQLAPAQPCDGSTGVTALSRRAAMSEVVLSKGAVLSVTSALRVVWKPQWKGVSTTMLRASAETWRRSSGTRP
uniref:Uncharacterized protein n=1 Tax=Alexandrium monilatum TaxID=311494 RepID=A0A7S4Q0N4_9DINO